MSGKRVAALLSSVFCLFVFIASSTGQLQNAPWPMYQHDPQHVGESEDYLLPYGEPSLEWSYVTGGYMTGSPALDENGTTYAGGDDNVFYAISSGGGIKWSYLTAGDISSSPAIDVADSVYAGSEDNRFYAFSSIGGLGWSYRTNGALESSPAIDTSGYVYIGSNDDRIYVFTSAGKFSWSYRAGDDLKSSPAIDTAGKVYIGSLDNRLYVYNSVGALSWSYLTDNNIRSSPMVVASEHVFVGSDDNNLYTLTSGGALAWSYAFPVESPSPFGIAAHPHPMVAIAWGNTVWVIWWWGEWLWPECHFHANGNIIWGPFVLRNRDIVFATNQTLYRIAPVCNPFTGHCLLKWQINIFGGGGIAPGQNRLSVAAAEQNLIYNLVNP